MDLNGAKAPMSSGFDGSDVYKFKKKLVKKSEPRMGGGNLSIEIKIDDSQQGPIFYEFTARNTNKFMNQVRGSKSRRSNQ